MRDASDQSQIPETVSWNHRIERYWTKKNRSNHDDQTQQSSCSKYWDNLVTSLLFHPRTFLFHPMFSVLSLLFHLQPLKISILLELEKLQLHHVMQRTTLLLAGGLFLGTTTNLGCHPVDWLVEQVVPATHATDAVECRPVGWLVEGVAAQATDATYAVDCRPVDWLVEGVVTPATDARELVSLSLISPVPL
jgi:hypothetical protein